MERQFDSNFNYSFISLKEYCEKENFKGWDPYDGLNSKIFQATPIKHWRIARLAWIQLFKRNPINLRKFFLIPKDFNAKGIALFLTSYCNLFKIAEVDNADYGAKKAIRSQISELAELLISLRSEGYSGFCWGYNFDWQNRVFFQPKSTPTVVATSFCADALFNAYETIGENKYLEVALSSASFVVNDLKQIPKGDNILFSYSPLDNSQVYNASLLGARLLARSYKYTKNENYLSLSNKVLNACIEVQKDDGSWFYGGAKNQRWIDSFHTGFNLECIWEYMQHTGDFNFQDSFDKGIEFYINNFFLQDGTPKYFHNKIYPIDIHSPAQLIVTLAKTERLDLNFELANRVLKWTQQNMQSSKGYFYYQLKKGISSKISYMRWAQAWMLYAYSYYLKTYYKLS